MIALPSDATIPPEVAEYLTLYNPLNTHIVGDTGTLDNVACDLAQTFWTTSSGVVLCRESNYANALAASALAGRLEVPLMFFNPTNGLSAAALSVIDNDLQCTYALTVNGSSTLTDQLAGIGVNQTSLADDKAIITWMQGNGYPVEYLAVCNVKDRTMTDYAPKGSLAAALLATHRNGALAALNYDTQWNVPFNRSSTTTVKPAGLPANAEPPRKFWDPEDLNYDMGSFTLNGVTHTFCIARVMDTDKREWGFIDWNNDGDYGDAGEHCPPSSEVIVNGRRYIFGVNSNLPTPYAYGAIRFTYPSDDELKDKLQEYHDQIGHYPKYMAIVGMPQVVPCAHVRNTERINWCDYVLTDNYFADVDDDPLYDIAIGRIVAENVTYVTLTAARGVTYEDMVPLDTSDLMYHLCWDHKDSASRLFSSPHIFRNYGFTVDEYRYLNGHPELYAPSYGIFIHDWHGWPFGLGTEIHENSSWTNTLVEGGGCNIASLDQYSSDHEWEDYNAVALAREGYVNFNGWVRGTGAAKNLSRDGFYKKLLDDGA